MADLFDYMDAADTFAAPAAQPENLFYIPPGAAFADLIAKQLIAETASQPVALSDYVLMVPNRRSAKVMRDAFLRQSNGAVTMLPTIRALGEADEDELAIYGAGGEQAALDLPPSIPDLQRKLLLTRLIMNRPDHKGDKPTADQAARLAGELARFLDQVQTENCKFDDLKGLVPAEFAEHWQLTLEFLQILTLHWPAILETYQVSDRAMRRNALIAAQITLWRENPPATPIIVAGSTGPFPALRDLMSAVLNMPHGRVVLPGLMTGLARDDWQAIGEDATHPQHLLGTTLRHIGRDPATVLLWPSVPAANPGQEERRRLAREALRPAQTTDQWRHVGNFASDVLDGVLRIDCSGAREEAATIALLMRDALEVPGKTCALVTPDRGLARRVATELRRWEVEVDDSAGIPLHDTAPAIYLRLVVRAVQEQFAPVPLLELLKHPLSAAGLPPEQFRVLTRQMEQYVLRGARPGPGLDGLQVALDGWRDETIDRITASGADNAAPRIERIRDDHARLSDLIARFETCLAPLLDLMDEKSISPVGALRCHIQTAEALAASDVQDGAERLWRGEAGEALADFVHELLQALTDFVPMPGIRYAAFLDALMAERAVRPKFGKHPRLFIWGTVEAQMQQADLTILGGLNEGVWPPEAGADPWMSRPMRRNFGLPAPEHRVGQSAHDFQQLFCAPDVVMTRALRIEGTPTVPSRWLLRIENILRKSGVSMEKPDAHAWRAMADLLDEPRDDMRRKIGRPAPTPPVSARPQRLSVTQIETWMRDPYAIYARHILGLRKLDGVDEDPGAADYGNLIHDALDQFISKYPDHLPPDGEHQLIMIGREVFKPLAARPGLWAFWWPRFERIARWFIQTEAARRDHVRKSYTEQSGTLETATGFEVYARADRIDMLRDGGIAIIDYKTGMPPSQTDVASGFAPQLPLEAAIAQDGGFKDVPAGPPASMAFWKLSGGDPAGEIREIDTKRMKTTPAELARDAVAGVNVLAKAFADEKTPYLSVPHPDHAPKYSDYVHLARLREWMGSEDVEATDGNENKGGDA
ncbi:double-strand break repair protein AddB [Thalassospira lucentensis]|uniref:Double-strand break repair protein AddB n=1 Tax=Thalassospira lucentensis TaxID=168935 RepID=A0A154L8Z8_9PROT|nr:MULTISPECIES: double-strand break repair protein AddB [Thalassospira]KZB66993.1 double-strand break repair protein AddB [Thalassospira lucentensis]MCH2273642.1 double-strand break repair protein AddB [Thalassospira sp.]